MPTPAHIARLRAHVGPELLLVCGVLAIVHDANGHVLLHRRRDDGLWGPPGGFIEPGETPAAAAAREVHEETGLTVEPTDVLGILGGPDYRHTYANGDALEAMIAVFACRIRGGTLALETDESTEIGFFPPDALPPLVARYPRQLLDPSAIDGRPYFDPPPAT